MHPLLRVRTRTEGGEKIDLRPHPEERAQPASRRMFLRAGAPFETPPSRLLEGEAEIEPWATLRGGKMPDNTRPRLALLLGDCTGIGPEIVAKALASGDISKAARVVLVGDAR